MELSKIKERLNELQSKPSKEQKEKIDYSKIYWKPKAGKHQIRIVPSKFDKVYPFKEVYLHYGFTKFPFYALTNWGEKDPIVEFTKKLASQGDKESWLLSKQLTPKMRVFAPVIVRGEEDKGVRLWEFGKEIYMNLLGIAEDPDYGDYTDISNGRDFTVDATEAEVAGRKGIKCVLRIKPNVSSLSEDVKLVEQWLEDQPNILEVNKKFTYDEVKNILTNFLEPENDSSTSENKSETKQSVGTVKKSSKFDSLFAD